MEVLRQLNEAFNRSDLEAALRCLHPEVEMHPGIQVPDEESLYAGHEGMTDWFRNATEPWEMIEVEYADLVECAGDRVLTDERWTFRGRDGIRLEMALANVFTFRDGLIVRIDGFTELAAARAAVGLPE